ncbi:hypothetical protein [Saudi moumouvirus]|nr:hypothetical protein [Saudi moumouvirus]
MATIDVSDIDPVILILCLWENASPSLEYIAKKMESTFFGFKKYKGKEPKYNNVKKLLKKTKYIDKIKGRNICTDFSDLTRVNTRSYNDIQGSGKFEIIVDKIRNFPDYYGKSYKPLYK